MLTENGILVVDGRELRVRISLRRRRLGLTVERDRALTLHVPDGCGVRRAEEFVRASGAWIDDKTRLSGERRQLHPVRTLRNGEIHRYLGRDYRLLIVDDQLAATADEGSGAAVRLVAGRFRLDGTVAADPKRARKAIADWYSQAGQRWMRGRLQPWAARMDVSEPAVHVRDLGHRWGSYRSGPAGGGVISLHWATFQLPIHLVDYVVAHELAHVRVSGHGPAYWRLLGRALPECRQLKEELDELGRRVWMGDMDYES
ncbi:M48 family metallopeptidase [Streptomyces paromomycinus]|uniref:Metal-dependent hydrolase n=1 Tax=Streptomyces paromomycinus TaxID=92743 RepID=A0A401W5Q3_STREY|nr:SprT family zinc-dependent metalloprotease [Streptomyces paromomycinus]GCD44660.1 metal-dependent hydrolase [Streptomyces paromomycinus]